MLKKIQSISLLMILYFKKGLAKWFSASCDVSWYYEALFIWELSAGSQ